MSRVYWAESADKAYRGVSEIRKSHQLYGITACHWIFSVSSKWRKLCLDEIRKMSFGGKQLVLVVLMHPDLVACSQSSSFCTLLNPKHHSIFSLKHSFVILVFHSLSYFTWIIKSFWFSIFGPIQSLYCSDYIRTDIKCMSKEVKPQFLLLYY